MRDYLGDIFSLNTLLFYSTLISYIFFNLLNFGEIKKSHSSMIRSPLSWTATAFAILIAWWASYYVTIHSSPRFSMAASFLSLGLFASIYNKNVIKISLCLISIILCYLYTPEATHLTLLAAISGGLSMILYALVSYVFSKKENR